MRASVCPVGAAIGIHVHRAHTAAFGFPPTSQGIGIRPSGISFSLAEVWLRVFLVIGIRPIDFQRLLEAAKKEVCSCAQVYIHILCHTFKHSA